MPCDRSCAVRCSVGPCCAVMGRTIRYKGPSSPLSSEPVSEEVLFFVFFEESEQGLADDDELWEPWDPLEPLGLPWRSWMWSSPSFRDPWRSSKSCATMEAVESNEENMTDPLECGKDESAGRITHTNSSTSVGLELLEEVPFFFSSWLEEPSLLFAFPDDIMDPSSEAAAMFEAVNGMLELELDDVFRFLDVWALESDMQLSVTDAATSSIGARLSLEQRK
jgi:hypothetical protein